jgi:hypothetical protein
LLILDAAGEGDAHWSGIYIRDRARMPIINGYPRSLFCEFGDFECSDPLHAGRAGYRRRFIELNVGLRAGAKTAQAKAGR